jgi:hypothetical protein
MEMNQEGNDAALTFFSGQENDSDLLNEDRIQGSNIGNYCIIQGSCQEDVLQNSLIS